MILKTKKKKVSFKKNKNKKKDKELEEKELEEITLEKINQLGKPVKFDNSYFPEAMIKKFTGCNNSFKCKGQKAGGELWIKDHRSGDDQKPNQRLDLLITFAYGQPKRAYQIIIKDVLRTTDGPIFTERPQFLGRVALPSGLSFQN